MNWDAIGAIAETLGAVGVIASLVYLAGQIRHSREQMSENTRALRGSTYQDLLGVQQQGQVNVAFDAEVSELMRRGLEDSSQLNEADAFRFNWLLGTRITMYDNALYQFEQGMLSPDRWRIMVANVRWTFRNPGVRTWWEVYDKDTASPEFVALVSEILGEEAEGADRPQ